MMSALGLGTAFDTNKGDAGESKADASEADEGGGGCGVLYAPWAADSEARKDAAVSAERGPGVSRAGGDSMVTCRPDRRQSLLQPWADERSGVRFNLGCSP